MATHAAANRYRSPVVRMALVELSSIHQLLTADPRLVSDADVRWVSPFPACCCDTETCPLLSLLAFVLCLAQDKEHVALLAAASLMVKNVIQQIADAEKGMVRAILASSKR